VPANTIHMTPYNEHTCTYLQHTLHVSYHHHIACVGDDPASRGVAIQGG